MKFKIIAYIFAATLMVSGCSSVINAAGDLNSSSGGPRYKNPMEDSQIQILQKQGINASIQIWRKEGCSSKGFNEVFAVTKKLKNISLRYVSVMSQFGKYSDVEIDMASEALVSSSSAQIGLLKDLAKRAEEMGCKSIERRAYNEIVASPVFGTGIAGIFRHDLMIAQSNLSQLGRR
jgi:hypothetical protein